MSFPAVRLTDPHVCPLVTGTVPHVGGPVLPPGMPRVLINGLPAARVTDPALCAGPPDSIAAGASTVLANGLPIARVGNGSLHGGVLINGSPTVLVGGTSVNFRFNLLGTPAQIAQMQQILALLYAIRTGRALIGRVSALRPDVSITLTDGTTFTDTTVIGGNVRSVSIEVNPNQQLDVLETGAVVTNAVVLGHEIIHAMHNLEGSEAVGYEWWPDAQGRFSEQVAREPERQAAGTPAPFDADGHIVTDANGVLAGTHVRDPSGTSYTPARDYLRDPGTQISENALRRDFGLPLRQTYLQSNSYDGPPW